MTAVLVLPSRLDLPAVGPLAQDILDHAGGDLVLDAGQVEHLGGLGLQVLLAAAQTWDADGAALKVTPRSAAFSHALDVFGLDPTALREGDSA